MAHKRGHKKGHRKLTVVGPHLGEKHMRRHKGQKKHSRRKKA